MGPDRPLGDRRERHREWEILVHRMDFGGPDNGGQREGCFQPREVFTDARTWSVEKRKKLPAVATLGTFRVEPVRVENQWVIPQGRIPMHGINPHGHKTPPLDA